MATSRSSRKLAASAHCKSSRKRTSGCSGFAKTPYESPEDVGESRMGFEKRLLRRRGLLADDELHLGEEIGDEPAIDADGVCESQPPRSNALLTRRENQGSELAECSHDRGVGHVALKLVELPCHHKAVRRSGRLGELANQRRLADAGAAGNQEQARPFVFEHLRESVEENSPLDIATVEPLGNEKAVRVIVFTERKCRDLSLPLPTARGTAPGRAGGRAQSGSGFRAPLRAASRSCPTRSSERKG